VPANGDDTDPDRDVSIIRDNRSRLHTRVERFASGLAHSQHPPPRTTHLVANIEAERAAPDPAPDKAGHGDRDGKDSAAPWLVRSTLLVAESRPGIRLDWVGRVTHHLAGMLVAIAAVAAITFRSSRATGR